VASPAAPDRIQNETIRTSPLAVAAPAGAEICTSADRRGLALTSMRRAIENGWPFTATVDIFADSPAALLNLNADAESAGRRAVAPISAAYAAQLIAATPALRRIVCTRFMMSFPNRLHCNRLLHDAQTLLVPCHGDDFGRRVQINSGRIISVGLREEMRIGRGRMGPAGTRSTPRHKEIGLICKHLVETGVQGCPGPLPQVEIVLQSKRRLGVRRRYCGPINLPVRLHDNRLPPLGLIHLAISQGNRCGRATHAHRHRHWLAGLVADDRSVRARKRRSRRTA